MPESIIRKASEFSRDFEVDPKLAAGVTATELLSKTLDFLHEELNETKDALLAHDQEEIIDGFGDVAFIALNGVYKAFRFLGDDHATARAKVLTVMHRICDANLGKKQPDGTIQYNNGKVIKPEGWQPPQYKDLLAA